MNHNLPSKHICVGPAIRKVLIYSFLTFWGIIVLFPFYWMVLTSVKSYGAYNSEYIPQLFTLSPTVQNYIDAFTAVPLGKYFLNTVIFTLATTALMLIVTVLARVKITVLRKYLPKGTAVNIFSIQ